MRDRGHLVSGADPDNLALATLAAIQGGLLLGQVQRTTQPLEAALDAMIALIESLTQPVPESGAAEAGRGVGSVTHE
jgi:hypothetical protein